MNKTRGSIQKRGLRYRVCVNNQTVGSYSLHRWAEEAAERAVSEYEATGRVPKFPEPKNYRIPLRILKYAAEFEAPIEYLVHNLEHMHLFDD